MTLRTQVVVVTMWVVSMFAAAMVGVYAQTPLPPREPRLPGSGLQAATEVISGNDFGFRVDSRKGNTPVGTIVVRVNGQWVEPAFSVGVKRVTSR